MKNIFSLLFVISLLTACSQTSTVIDKDAAVNDFLIEADLKQAGSSDRIVNFTISSWKYIDPYHLMIKTRNRDQYLVGLRFDCRRLANVETIGTSSTTGSLSKFDKVIFRDSVDGRVECLIGDIAKLEPNNKEASNNTEESE